MTQVALVQFCHMQSTRLPCKPILELKGKPLLEHTLHKFKYISDVIQDAYPVVIFPETDYMIRDLCDKYGVEYYLMKTEHAKGRIWPELIQPFLFYLQQYDVVCDINWMCHPFLELSTIDDLIYYAKTVTFGWTAAVQKRGTLWGEGRDLILGRGELADTQNNPIYFEPAHIMYAWQRHDLSLCEDQLSSKVIPVPYKFAPHELIDIDDEATWQFARQYARDLPI